MLINGSPAVVQRALMSGGIAGVTDQRQMLVRIQFGPMNGRS